MHRPLPLRQPIMAIDLLHQPPPPRPPPHLRLLANAMDNSTIPNRTHAPSTISVLKSYAPADRQLVEEHATHPTTTVASMEGLSANLYVLPSRCPPHQLRILLRQPPLPPLPLGHAMDKDTAPQFTIVPPTIREERCCVPKINSHAETLATQHRNTAAGMEA